MSNNLSEDSIKKTLALHEANHYYVGTYQGETGLYILLEVPTDKLSDITSKQKTIEETLRARLQTPSLFLTIHTQNAKPQHKMEKRSIEGIENIITVGAGKGGVGKSSVALQLALSFKEKGLRVGLMDADIYGPSLSVLIDTHEKPQVDDNKKILPLIVNGLKCISLGMFMEKDQPAMWRGPMIQGAISQFLRDVNWGELDILLIDLPPGTGDAQMSIMQMVPLKGAILVSTSQDLALIEAIKAKNMFDRFKVPILGLIENMTSFECPHCGENTSLFQKQNLFNNLKNNDIKLLGSLSYDSSIHLTPWEPSDKIKLAFQHITSDLISSTLTSYPTFLQKSP